MHGRMVDVSAVVLLLLSMDALGESGGLLLRNAFWVLLYSFV
jgi:hypothetical protein